MQSYLQIVTKASMGGGPLEVLAKTGVFPTADLLSEGDGWLSRLARLSGAPFGLDLYVSGARGEGWREVDAFALATVYGQVIWDDRIWGWHGESGRPDSAERAREIHDLALHAYRGLGDGERLVLVDEE